MGFMYLRENIHEGIQMNIKISVEVSDDRFYGIPHNYGTRIEDITEEEFRTAMVNGADAISRLFETRLEEWKEDEFTHR